ncbi:MarR family winged helix-turn-helix transcriptional regulator [Microbacterium sp. NPDC077663]|uniref:MarR family winged helix-turn-helix transcriptional regulator n=1 Tax=Microbacterium sp. NPDC077663 TaxID=3364189 RepID=UPI0037C7985E
MGGWKRDVIVPRPPQQVLVPRSSVDSSAVLPEEREPLLELFERLIRVANSEAARRALIEAARFPSSEISSFLVFNQVALHGALRPTDLAERLETGRPNVTKIVKRLETLGLAVRVADPSDERGVLVALSDYGRVIASRLVDIERHWIGVALAGWDPTDITRFTAMLSRFVDGISASQVRQETSPG